MTMRPEYLAAIKYVSNLKEAAINAGVAMGELYAMDKQSPRAAEVTEASTEFLTIYLTWRYTWKRYCEKHDHNPEHLFEVLGIDDSCAMLESMIAPCLIDLVHRDHLDPDLSDHMLATLQSSEELKH